MNEFWWAWRELLEHIPYQISYWSFNLKRRHKFNICVWKYSQAFYIDQTARKRVFWVHISGRIKWNKTAVLLTYSICAKLWKWVMEMQKRLIVLSPLDALFCLLASWPVWRTIFSTFTFMQSSKGQWMISFLVDFHCAVNQLKLRSLSFANN